jgi:YihY family inner membrane protein
MNLVESELRRIDRWQQRGRVVPVIFGVVKKYGDDRGTALAAQVAFYGFISMFPLLLILTTILGFVGNARLQDSIVGTTLHQFPIFGDQIGPDVAHPLKGSTLALVIGLLSLTYGSLGVGQSAQHAMAQVWNVPGAVRPGYLQRLGRSLVLFLVVAVGLSFTAATSAMATVANRGWGYRILLLLAGAVLNCGLFVAVFRVLTPKTIAWRHLLIGSIVGGIGYSILLNVGTALVQHQLRHTEAIYGHFALVLGLIGWLYLLAQLLLYAAEINVVLTRRLWPRSILQPPLTDADERVLHDIARQEERRLEERVGVGFPPDAVAEAALDAGRPAGKLDRPVAQQLDQADG